MFHLLLQQPSEGSEESEGAHQEIDLPGLPKSVGLVRRAEIAVAEHALLPLESPVRALCSDPTYHTGGTCGCGIQLPEIVGTMGIIFPDLVQLQETVELASRVKQPSEDVSAAGQVHDSGTVGCHYGYFRAVVLCQDPSHMVQVQGPLRGLLHRLFLFLTQFLLVCAD